MTIQKLKNTLVLYSFLQIMFDMIVFIISQSERSEHTATRLHGSLWLMREGIPMIVLYSRPYLEEQGT